MSLKVQSPGDPVMGLQSCAHLERGEQLSWVAGGGSLKVLSEHTKSFAATSIPVLKPLKRDFSKGKVAQLPLVICSIVGNDTLTTCVIKSCKILCHSVLVCRKDEEEAGGDIYAEDA